VRSEGERLVLHGSGPAVAALRALCAAVWRRADVPVPEIAADGAAAREALADLGLRTASAT
jgi:hypothetical protein